MKRSIYKNKNGGNKDCFKNFYPSREYVSPSYNNFKINNLIDNKTAIVNASTDIKSLNSKSNDCNVSPSQSAWDLRFKEPKNDLKSGGGYYLTYKSLSHDSCTNKRNSQKKSKGGALKKSVQKLGCGHDDQYGSGNAVQVISDLIAPLGVNKLAVLVVLLFLNAVGKNTKKIQKGGGFDQLVNIILPMGKNNLVVLASLLLLNYFSINNSKKYKQVGGSDILPIIDNLLAPIGVNAFGTSWLLVILNEALGNKNLKQKQKGGGEDESNNNDNDNDNDNDNHNDNEEEEDKDEDDEDEVEENNRKNNNKNHNNNGTGTGNGNGTGTGNTKENKIKKLINTNPNLKKYILDFYKKFKSNNNSHNKKLIDELIKYLSDNNQSNININGSVKNINGSVKNKLLEILNNNKSNYDNHKLKEILDALLKNNSNTSNHPNNATYNKNSNHNKHNNYNKHNNHNHNNK